PTAWNCPLSLHDALPISEQAPLTASFSLGVNDSNGTPSWRANSPGFSKIKRGSAVTVDSSLKMETSGKSTTSFPKVGEGQTPLRSEEHTSELQSRVDLVC